MSISSYCILKNEAEFVRDCLRCLAWFSEEIILVVDPTSTDDTLQLCEEFAYATNIVKIIQRETPWSLAEQREFARQQCKGHWIFTLDGDEVIHAAILQALPEMLTSGADAFMFPRLVMWPDKFHYLHKGGDVDPQIKLFRNSPNIEYETREGGVHHYLTRHGRDLLQPAFVNVPILHYQLLKPDEKLRQKELDFMARQTENSPMNVYEGFYQHVRENEGVKTVPLSRFWEPS